MWNKCSTFAPKLHNIMYTKTKNVINKLFCATLSAVFMTILLTSCMSKSQETSTAQNTCYVSKVSFNNFRRLTTGKASDGVTDSTFYVPYTANNWTFTIDHRTLFIENRDSLPYKTDLSRVLMNLSYIGGIAYHRASDAWSDDPWVTYNASDSLDLRKPLHIKIVATDKTERIYTLRVNVHTMEADSLRWHAVEGNAAISGEYPMKAVAMNGKIAVLVNDGSAVICMTHVNSNLGEWNRFVTNLPVNVDLNSFVKGEENVYISATDGSLYTSTDGLEWTMICQQEGLRLIGVSDEKLYAIFNGVMNSAPIKTLEWGEEYMDDEGSMLPDKEIAILTYLQSKDLTRMILVGNRSLESDTTAVVWSKCWTDFEDEDYEGWMHYTRTLDNTRQMPMFTQMNLMHYDDKLFMAAGKSVDGKIKALERFYVSHDNGLTWERFQGILPPADIQGVSGYLTSIVDDDYFIWLIAGGKVYRGRINRLGFERPSIY